MSKIYIDFSNYGYNEYYAVDKYWLNYNMCLAENCFAEITDMDQAKIDLAVEKIELMLDSRQGPMDTMWLGAALFNMAMWGMFGHSVPEYYFTDEEE
jgi:hypothetical protein